MLTPLDCARRGNLVIYYSRFTFPHLPLAYHYAGENIWTIAHDTWAIAVVFTAVMTFALCIFTSGFRRANATERSKNVICFLNKQLVVCYTWPDLEDMKNTILQRRRTTSNRKNKPLVTVQNSFPYRCGPFWWQRRRIIIINTFIFSRVIT